VAITVFDTLANMNSVFRATAVPARGVARPQLRAHATSPSRTIAALSPGSFPSAISSRTKRFSPTGSLVVASDVHGRTRTAPVPAAPASRT
jgi:hypothetical protein